MKRTLKRLQPGRNGFQFIVDPNTRKELSPIVFFDAGTQLRKDDGLRIGMHPHSGIGIVTYFEGADLHHDDTGNNTNVLKDGGVQWIRAGSGIWHNENYLKKETTDSSEWPLTIHQLWIQLPKELEESSPSYLNFQPEQVKQSGNVKVIIGDYNGVSSDLKLPYAMTYLDIELKANETLDLPSFKGQSKGFVFVRSGEVSIHETNIPKNHMGILEENDGVISIAAAADSKFILVLSEAVNNQMVSMGGSIHTNPASMERSQEDILKIGQERGFI